MTNDRPRCLARETQFFKVLVDDFTEKLSIPKAFIEKMPERLSGTVILHGPSGNCWPVRLSRTSKGTYLAGGWEAFVKHHSLTEGEFLVFNRVRSMHFDVKIFGKKACERGDAFTVQASLGLTCRQFKGKTQSPRGDEAKFTTKDTFIFKASHGSTCLKEKNKCQSPRRDAGKITSTSESKVLEKKANKDACCFTSQFPFFHIQIQAYCLGVNRYLSVPAAFVPNLPRQTRNMTLRTANDRKWKVKYCFCVSSPCRISVGWKQFASDNHIKGEGKFVLIRMMNGEPRCLARETRFFKVLVDDFTEKLSIPKAFIEKIPEGLSGTVILHGPSGPSGNCWPVRLSRTSKGTYLAGGWEAFVKHHSLIEGEFLVFSSVRSMHFDVKIYGRNACERGDALTVEASLGLTCRQLKGKTQSPRGDEAKFTAKDTSTFKASHGPTSLKERKKCQSPRRDAGKITSISKLKVRGANEAAHHFANGLVRPYFVSQIQHYFLHTQKYLAVPAFFVREYLPKTQMMKLWSPDGREWPVKFYYGLPRSPNRICRPGWVEFASANHIKEGDSCVFELVQYDTLQMHIFRC